MMIFFYFDLSVRLRNFELKWRSSVAWQWRQDHWEPFVLTKSQRTLAPRVSKFFRILLHSSASEQWTLLKTPLENGELIGACFRRELISNKNRSIVTQIDGGVHAYLYQHMALLVVCSEEANTRGFFNEFAELRCVKTCRTIDRITVP